MSEGPPASASNAIASADSRRYCSRCSPGLFRRINRVTLLERTFFTWIGLFPWECVNCRRKRFFRDPGRKARTPLAT
jgi:hypothetical protein